MSSTTTRAIRKLVGIGALILVGAIALGAARSQIIHQRVAVSDKVLLLAAHFNNGVWSGGSPRLLSCKSCSKTGLVDLQANATDALVRALDSAGQEIYRLKMPNPRMVLVEDPTVLPALKTSANFDLRLPYDARMTLVQFYEKGTNTTPSFVASVLSPQPLPSTTCQFVNQPPTVRTLASR